MKEAMFYENPEEHKTLLEALIPQYIQPPDCNLNIVKNLKEAEEILKKRKIEFAIIHHSDFDCVDKMREISPKTKFIAWSGRLETNPLPGSIGEVYLNSMKESYDALLDSFLELGEIIEELNKKSKSLKNGRQ